MDVAVSSSGGTSRLVVGVETASSEGLFSGEGTGVGDASLLALQDGTSGLVGFLAVRSGVDIFLLISEGRLVTTSKRLRGGMTLVRGALSCL